MTDPALMARPGVPGRASVRCSPESCRSPRARRRTRAPAGRPDARSR